ncbi:MAG TPA: hypothetical protein PLD54_00960 [Candidatus Levybacteria bacterium]|nr:hypothetical protein [Candidatus Levybacteria bacterium]
MKKNSTSIAVFKTLVYSDVFGSPLTFDELYRYLYRHKISKKDLRVFLRSTPHVKKIGAYYVLLGREALVAKHYPKVKESKRKKGIAEKTIKILSKIPTIQMIGISGSLAVNSATKEADIDLFIITRHNALWITRLLVTGIVYLQNKKRAAHVRIAPDTICTNMWMSEKHLTLPHKNLFIAREVVQMQVVMDRNNTYAAFLQANVWVYTYFPNFAKQLSFAKKTIFPSVVFALINMPVYCIQWLYMRKKRTTETISLHYAAFHPQDISKLVLQTYTNRLRVYKNHKDVKNVSTPDTSNITPGS